ncbi:C40 family peptidase (plasmid) [Clostridium baratii]
MNKEVSLIKKIFKYLVLSNLGFIIITSLILGAVLGFVGASNSSNSEYDDMVDIGALGIPQEYVSSFNEVSNYYKIPNWIFAGVSKQESNFNPNCVSPDGAYGIMQFQKQDIGAGGDLWVGAMKEGLEKVYKDNGYKFKTYQEMWDIFLKDVKAQIIAGGFELRRYFNYVLWKLKYTDKLDYNSTENMKLVPWNAKETDTKFKEILRRTFACYNGGPTYGMNVDLDKAQNNYPNQVYKYCMEFRNGGLIDSNVSGNKVIEAAIKAGEKWVGKSPYVWGGGRNEADVKAGRFDCSSFIHYCFASAGVQLGDRSSVVTFSLVKMGKPIKPKDMKRGDVIFFDTYTTDGHVAIYLGGNKFMHDSTSQGVTITEFNDYWKSKFNGKVRRYI